MSLMVPIALFGWIPIILLMFSQLSPRRAVAVCFVFAWMFLPSTGYEIAGLPDYTKASATSIGVLLAVALFDTDRLVSFRLRLLDLPMVVWCICPLASSLSNGLGWYDGASAVLAHTIKWGIPYYIGRVYFRDWMSIRELAMWIFIGGLVYMPLCLWEIRMSPQLNRWVYGFGGAGVEYVTELGVLGSRPRVFMGTALTVGVFMTAASLMGMWLCGVGGLRRVCGMSARGAMVILIGTTLLCKNAGGVALLLLGAVVFVVWKRSRTAWPLYALIAAVPLYMLARGNGVWSGQPMIEIARAVHERRAQSLETRFRMENLITEKALRKPAFGWGGWGRWRVTNEQGRDITLPDGQWVIALGETGITGLAAFTAAMLLPATICVWRLPRPLRLGAAGVPVIALSTLVVLYMVDNLFNAMPNPTYVVTAGGLATICTTLRSRSPALRAVHDWTPGRHRPVVGDS